MNNATTSNTKEREDEIKRQVLARYEQFATQGQPTPGSGCCAPSSACSSSGSNATCAGITEALGYSKAELETLPESADMNLSCGNPTALASLQEGEVVLDLGSGGGLDVFLAAQKVGHNGRVIGVDMTAEMLSKARANAVQFSKRTGLANVEFRLGEIEHLPVADSTVDVIISNCVVNLSPNKSQVWREMSRVLKPGGGRVCISDLALTRPMPEGECKKAMDAFVGCVAGAVLVEDTLEMIKEAGLVAETVEKKSAFMEQMEAQALPDDPLYQKIMEHMPEGMAPRDYVTSLNIVARKP